MGKFRDRHGRPAKPVGIKEHKRPGFIKSQAKAPVRGIDPDMLRPSPMSGSRKDSDRVRLVRNFYAQLPDEISIYQELVEEVVFNSALNQRYTIVSQRVPSDRTFVVDNVSFFATPLFGLGLVPAGSIEGAVQLTFQIGNVVPIEISTTRVQPGLPAENRAYFPFLNDRVGAREVNFSLFAKQGRDLTAFYVNRAISPIPLRTVGVRIEGWMIDSNAIEELMEQQQ